MVGGGGGDGHTHRHTNAKKWSGRWEEWLFGGFGRVVVVGGGRERRGEGAN